ncbi:hypothetical protein [Gelidibacter salicanalis]|uniref:hypothetical protein n=1 Tax=Gelidibacter salicanalis TaxID=291193 RepID=UPI003F76BA31
MSKGKLHCWIKKLSSAITSPDRPSYFVPITFPSGQEQEIRSISIRCASGVEIEIPV